MSKDEGSRSEALREDETVTRCADVGDLDMPKLIADGKGEAFSGGTSSQVTTATATTATCS